MKGIMTLQVGGVHYAVLIDFPMLTATINEERQYFESRQALDSWIHEHGGGDYLPLIATAETLAVEVLRRVREIAPNIVTPVRYKAQGLLEYLIAELQERV